MPKSPDPQVRTALIDTAALLLGQGPEVLTTRRLAEQVGTSTMAVYTHFRGMDDLRKAVRKEGFDRLAAHLEAVGPTDDPVADVAASGGAYLFNAITNAHLYRFMFMEAIDEDDDIGDSTFERLVAGVERAIQSERWHKADPYAVATQLWALTHGIVTLHLAGLMTLPEAIDCVTDGGRNLFIGFGDEPAAADRSIQAARERFGDVLALIEETA
jgi:AcrR family transcriptional regulator